MVVGYGLVKEMVKKVTDFGTIWPRLVRVGNGYRLCMLGDLNR